MSINKVLNRPMFRREALRKGHLKPIRANTGVFAGPPTPPPMSTQRPGGGPLIMSGTKGPFPKMFSYNPVEGSYLTKYGANQLRRFPGRFAAPLMMYGGLEAAGVPAPVTTGVLGAELFGLAAGLFGPKGKMVSPQIQELFMLVEDLYKSVEKIEKNQEMNMTNKVNIEFISKQLEKAMSDIEKLKDKVRANGKSAH